MKITKWMNFFDENETSMKFLDENYKLMNNLIGLSVLMELNKPCKLNNKSQQNIMSSSYLKLFHYNSSNIQKL
jgi:hypothetical protein